jgi:hypothetical protein
MDTYEKHQNPRLYRARAFQTPIETPTTTPSILGFGIMRQRRKDPSQIELV